MKKQKGFEEHRKISVCVGCGSQIHDQFILRVAPDLEWHASCLRCVDCNQYLSDSCSCFVKDGKIYCRADYIRLYGNKCSKCHQVCGKNEYVMRVRDNMYHIECFRCMTCNRQLIPGDEFVLKDDKLYCTDEHEATDSDRTLNEDEIKVEISENNEDVIDKMENTINNHKGGKVKNGDSKKKSQQKPSRGRTVLNEKQLQTLCTWYNANPRPDALMKEQLVEMTNLSPRVIRVWFQNKRCKDNKRSLLTKQLQQEHQEKNTNRMCGPLHGIPMVASSPDRHENHIQINPIEVQTYQQTIWPNTEQPPLQQLMNSFDKTDSDSSSLYPSPVFNNGYVWNQPNYNSSDFDYTNESRMSASPMC